MYFHMFYCFILMWRNQLIYTFIKWEYLQRGVWKNKPTLKKILFIIFITKLLITLYKLLYINSSSNSLLIFWCYFLLNSKKTVKKLMKESKFIEIYKRWYKSKSTTLLFFGRHNEFIIHYIFLHQITISISHIFFSFIFNLF